MKEMIRRFDEVLSEKASKMALKELQYDFDNRFVQVRHWDKLQSDNQTQMKAQEATMQLVKDSVARFEANLADEIDQSVKRGLSKYMVNYEKVLAQF